MRRSLPPNRVTSSAVPTNVMNNKRKFLFSIFISHVSAGRIGRRFCGVCMAVGRARHVVSERRLIARRHAPDEGARALAPCASLVGFYNDVDGLACTVGSRRRWLWC